PGSGRHPTIDFGPVAVEVAVTQLAAPALADFACRRRRHQGRYPERGSEVEPLVLAVGSRQAVVLRGSAPGRQTGYLRGTRDQGDARGSGSEEDPAEDGGSVRGPLC